MISTMIDKINIVIQFITGHKNMKGNEMADLQMLHTVMIIYWLSLCLTMKSWDTFVRQL